MLRDAVRSPQDTLKLRSLPIRPPGLMALFFLES